MATYEVDRATDVVDSALITRDGAHLLITNIADGRPEVDAEIAAALGEVRS